MKNSLNSKKNNNPLSYQEWHAILDGISNSSFSSQDIYSLISVSTFEGSSQLQSNLKKKIIDAVNKMLSVRIFDFQKQFMSTMEISDYDYINLITKRFKRRLLDCYFFRKIVFIEQDFISALEVSLNIEIRKFHQTLMQSLYQIEEEVKNDEYENMIKKLSCELSMNMEESSWEIS